MMKEFVPDHRMRGKHDEPVTFDAGGMRIGGIGHADNFRPVLPDDIFRR